MNPHLPMPLILCEGKEDKLVLEALAKHLGLEGRIHFESYGGKDALKSHLATLKVRPGYSRGEISKVLVTRDADTNHERAWAAIKGAISTVFACELSQPGHWEIIDGGPLIAAWVIPGPQKTGMIETLCMESARAKSAEVFSCLDSFVDCLTAVHGDKLHEKARFALWTIAAQGNQAKDWLSVEFAMPNLPINWDDEVFSSLKELIVAAVETIR
jgi:hypothetical protein